MKTLLLFPDVIYYEWKSEEFYSYLRRSVANIHKLAKQLKWDLHCLLSDEVAIQEAPDDVKWINTMSRADVKFMIANNPNMENISYIPKDSIVSYDDLIADAMNKYPVIKVLDTQTRFSITCDRENMVKKKVLKQYKSFIIFGSRSHKTYPVVPKEDDGALIMYIDLTFFKAETYMNGKKVSNIDILMNGTTNNAVYSWEV